MAGGRRLTGWIAANVGTAVPQAMAPITFGLVTLAERGVNGGALMMAALTAAQVVGAVPVAAAGRRLPASAYARALALFRATAFAVLAVAVWAGAHLVVLVALAFVAGFVNGALFGIMRAVLNDLVTADRLPRALGLVATANELVFVTAPVLAATLGDVTPVASVAVMVAASAVPVLTLPRVAARPVAPPTGARPSSLPRGVVPWLLAGAGSAACVGSIEVGAVALALRAGLDPRGALLFVVPLCLASVSGGLCISVLNRRLGRPAVVGMLVATSAATLVVAWGGWVWAAVAAVVVIGAFLAPLVTSVSLSIEGHLPVDRRAEGFALLRTCQAVGIIVSSLLVAFTTPGVACATAAVLAAVAAVAVTRPLAEA